MILKFPQSFPEYSTVFFFFQNFDKYYSKLIPFSNFCCIFSIVPQSLIDVLSSFLQNPRICFQRFTRGFDKITVEIFSNFYSGLLKNSLASFQTVLKFFLTLRLFFSNN